MVQALVLPNDAFFARLIQVSELLVGILLLIGAADIGRRRFAGRLGAPHGYEPALPLGSAIAGLAAAGLTLSIGILMGEGFPTVAAGRAFTSAIPIELFIVRRSHGWNVDASSPCAAHGSRSQRWPRPSLRLTAL